MTEELDLDFLRGERPPSFDEWQTCEHLDLGNIDTMDVYYFGGPFAGWVGKFPCIDGQPMQNELAVIAEDSEERVEGVYIFDGQDTEGRPLLRWQQRGAGADAD